MASLGGKAATLTVKILTDASEAARGTEKAASGYRKFQKGVDSLVPAAAATVAAVTAIGVKTAESASRVEQAFGALDSVFGKNAATVKAWANDAADSVGLSAAEYGEFASVIGAQLNNLGLSTSDAMSGTKSLIALGADLAATFGGSTSEAVGALSAALRGEADPAERYGLSLNQTAINARLAEKGMSKLTGAALRTAKTQTILEMATEQAGGAVGQFARESDTAAGAQQRAAAQWENATAAIGEAFLPIVIKAADAMSTFGKWAQENSGLLTTLMGVIGAIAGVILGLSAAMKIATVVMWAWNAAADANPIGILIAAVAALVAAFIWLWNNVDGFRNFFIKVWKGLQAVIGAVVKWFKSAWNSVLSWFRSAINAIRVVVGVAFVAIRVTIATVVKWFRSAWSTVSQWFRSVVGAWRAVFSVVFNAIRKTVGVIVTWFRSVWTVISQWFRNVINGWRVVFSVVFNAIRTTVGVIIKWFRSVWTVISQWFRNVINGWRAVFSVVFNAIRGTIGTVVGWFRSVWSGLSGWFRSIVGGFRSVFVSVFSTIRSVVTGVINTIKNVVNGLRSVFSSVFNAILRPINAVVAAFRQVVSWIRTVISWLGRIHVPDVFGAIGNLFNSTRSAAPQQAAAVPTAAARSPQLGGVLTRAVPGGSSGGGITINVQGGLDSAETIARRVQQVLTASDRRRAGVVLPRRAAI